MLVLLPLVDGTVDPQEGWHVLGISSISNTSVEGADLDTLWGAVGPDSLYLALKTKNLQNWNVSYGVGLDIDRVLGSGYDRQEGNIDPHGREITFVDSMVLDNRPLGLSVDAFLYLDWDATQDTLTPILYVWDGTSWVIRGGVHVAFTAGAGGLSVAEVAVAIDSVGGRIAHLAAWTTSTTGSALDCIPSDNACADNADEFTDVDTLTQFVRLSPWSPDSVVIQEVMYDAPSGCPEPEGEWVELLNPSNDTADLSFLVFSDDPVPGASEGYVRFPADILVPPQGFLLLVHNPDTFATCWGFLLQNPLYASTPILSYGNVDVGNISMANTGDDIHLFRPSFASPWDSLVPISEVWYGSGGDMGSTGAAVDAPAGSSIERNPQSYPVWSGVPVIDFYANATPSPGNLPPQVNDITYPSYENGRFVVQAVVRDVLPLGDGIVSDTLFYRFYSTGSGWGAWMGAWRDSSIFATVFYSFDTTATSAESVQYYIVATDSQGTRFGDTLLTGLRVSDIEEGKKLSGLTVRLQPGVLLIGPSSRTVVVDILDLSGRRRLRRVLPPASHRRQLMLKVLPPGVYMFEVNRTIRGKILRP